MQAEKIDPFYEAKHEVDISINKLQDLYNNWNNIADKNSTLAKEKYTLIKEEIKYLNQDLNDLDNSVNVVKKNLFKFKISTEEIENRTKSLKIIRDILNNISNNTRYNAFNYNSNINSDYDNVILKKQDDGLDELAESAERLHHAAVTINTELKDQQKLLEELEDEIDNSNEKMNFVTKKISHYLKTNNPKVLSLILYLLIISFVLLFILIIT